MQYLWKIIKQGIIILSLLPVLWLWGESPGSGAHHSEVDQENKKCVCRGRGREQAWWNVSDWWIQVLTVFLCRFETSSSWGRLDLLLAFSWDRAQRPCSSFCRWPPLRERPFLTFLYLNLDDKRIKSPFTAFVFWMRRCVLLTSNMRAFWGAGSVLGAGIIAGSRTGIVAPLGPLIWNQGWPPWAVPCGPRPVEPGACFPDARGQWVLRSISCSVVWQYGV